MYASRRTVTKSDYMRGEVPRAFAQRLNTRQRAYMAAQYAIGMQMREQLKNQTDSNKCLVCNQSPSKIKAIIVRIRSRVVRIMSKCLAVFANGVK